MADSASKTPETVSIVIPGYNEEKRILPTLEVLQAYCRKNFARYEIVYVDDGSGTLIERVRDTQDAEQRLPLYIRAGIGLTSSGATATVSSDDLVVADDPCLVLPHSNSYDCS